MFGPTNEDRADWAEEALNAFRPLVYGDPQSEDNGTAFCDLMCDLRHLADRYGLDWQDVLAGVESNYQEEIEEHPPAEMTEVNA